MVNIPGPYEELLTVLEACVEKLNNVDDKLNNHIKQCPCKETTKDTPKKDLKKIIKTK